MANASAARMRAVTPVPIQRIGEEILGILRSDGVDPKAMARVKQVLRILEGMGLGSTTGLILSPDFVGRFLAAWGGSTRHGTVVAILGALGSIVTAAVTLGHLEPSAFDRRPIPIPPEWDEDLRPGGRRAATGPSRSADEFARLVAQLMHPGRSGTWEGGRLLFLTACVALADLLLSEALQLVDGDFGIRPGSPDVPILAIRARERIRKPRAPAIIDVPRELVALKGRWAARTHGQWLIPDIGRAGPWAYRGTGKQGFMPVIALKSACEDAGVGDFTFDDVARLGRESVASLFSVTPGDGVLAMKPLSLDALEVAVRKSYDSPSNGTICELRRAFRTLRLLGVETSIELGSPGIGERFTSATGEADPAKLKSRLKWLHSVIRTAIRLGHLDLDPLSGRHSIPHDPRPEGSRPHRRLLSLIGVPRERPGRRCPVELRGEGLPIRVHGKDLPQISGIAYTILGAVVDGFHRGGGCTPSELSALTESSRPLRLFALALERAGFEPLRRVIPSYKGEKGRIIEIVDIGPEP